ncbi:FtsK/SpoIIIE domain-containing protein [Kitasatospora viridis]|uniref:S-DNA-T family DNA segregation ATPase FtsK/SpoIIIE n=1 Tax=Kitasatospora viridis TaxID=281105 RepID=A0A561UL19_9ACTN|nr:FtsK/SpoIIIE domain-containing protein [Kitasatospora viridis]TWG00054.1 S-DNA-T family DNA segregation ATPase FtsK/SpoIIIE [Kitasatospora viridis]
MGLEILWLLVLAAAAGLAIAAPGLRGHRPDVWWCLIGYPVTVLRAMATWRRLTTTTGLAVPRRPARLLVGSVVLKGDPLRPVPPRMRLPLLRQGGLETTVRMHPGQVPADFAQYAEALAHAWRMFAVRVVAEGRGSVRLVALAWDPLASPRVPKVTQYEPLRAVVGRREDGAVWAIDLHVVPHWLVVGATRSGKSTLIAALVKQLAPQRLALFGIDLKGGMELSLFEVRLSELAPDRSSAARLLARLVAEAEARMALCRAAGVRAVKDLPKHLRRPPIVLIVDEVAELYLMASRDDKAEVAEISTNLLRIAQLGAALDVHLVIAGQRVGSDLGPGVTALRAQLGGRVCHRVSDPGTAEMALGDLSKEALTAAQQITMAQQGVAVVIGEDGQWIRARSIHVAPEEAQRVARKYAEFTPVWREEEGTYR